jgi:MFS superfamily sulfate permease-like transporter
LTFQTARGSWQKACLLCFLTGVTELLMGFFGLGFLIDFVSGPVSSGFTSAVALIILSSQVKDIFGIKASGTTFVQMWSSILDNIGGIRVWDTVLGFSCIVILLLMRVSKKSLTQTHKTNATFPRSFSLTLKLAQKKTTRNQRSKKLSTKLFGW